MNSPIFVQNKDIKIKYVQKHAHADISKIQITTSTNKQLVNEEI